MSVKEAEEVELSAADGMERAWRLWLRGEITLEERLHAEQLASMAYQLVLEALRKEAGE